MRNLPFQIGSLLLITLSLLIWFKISISPKSDSPQFKTFVVPEGQSLKVIAKRLEEEGLIRNGLSFRILVTTQGLSKKIQAGLFKLSPSQSLEQIATVLTYGRQDIWVTIPEGWRVEEIAAQLNQKLGIDKTEFLEVAKEGLMFPDTYLIPKTAKAEMIAKMMRENFDKRVSNLQEQIENSGLTLEQVIILASVVEREAKFEKDRPVVSGILIKRWKAGLGLEADATVQYAVGFREEDGWWKKTLTEPDLKINSPYNTRKFAGLPPTPISNPGLSSIKAIISPTATDFLYYLSDKEGEMHYAKTLGEHIENIRQFL